MNDDALIARLRGEVFPALAEQRSEETDRTALALRLARKVAGQIAAACGLDPAAAGMGAEAKQPDLPPDLEFSEAAVALPGLLYADLSADRYTQGSYYTPLSLARRVVGWVLGEKTRQDFDHTISIFDPAMGAGHFLIAAAERLAGPEADAGQRWTAAQRVYGVDADEGAVELARIALWTWAGRRGTSPEMLERSLTHADALLDDLPEGWPNRFGAVVGNPPYASVFTRASSEADAYHLELRNRYSTAQGSFDLAVPFVQRAVRLCAAGGRIGLVLPNKLLAASYAERLRTWLRERVTVEIIADYSTSPVFDADVYPVVLVMRRQPPTPAAPFVVLRDEQDGVAAERRGVQADLHGLPGNTWSPALSARWASVCGCFDGSRRLDEVADLSGGLTVGEAYDLRPRVVDAPLGALPGDGLRLIVSGTVGRYRTLWGEKTTRYLKHTFKRPVVMIHALPERRREQARQQKIIVAGLSQRPRAFVDGGLSQASVGTTVIFPHDWPPGALCALLNSALMADLYRSLFGGLALSGGYLRVGKRELGALPVPDIPADDERLSTLSQLAGKMARADTLERPELDAQIEALVRALYGV